jgi:hypothetical protein
MISFNPSVMSSTIDAAHGPLLRLLVAANHAPVNVLRNFLPPKVMHLMHARSVQQILMKAKPASYVNCLKLCVTRHILVFCGDN